MTAREASPLEGIASDGVAKRFARTSPLTSVSFWAPPGEVTLLAGRNGAGKTTWLRIASGLARASAGAVRFAGRDVSQVRRSLAVVSDEPPVYGRFSCHDNLRLISGLRRPPSAGLAEVREMLALDERLLRQRAKGYSLGQRRRLAIACALLRGPRFFFLDEPTIGLDPIAWAAVREALRACALRGTTVLLTGQDFRELEAIFDRIAVLAGGVIAFEGNRAGLLRRRPPRVRVTADRPQGLHEALHRPCTQIGPSTVEFPCADERDARRTLEHIRQLNPGFTELSVKHDTLEEAFLALHADAQGAFDAESR